MNEKVTVYIQGLTKCYGKKQALKPLNLRIAEGVTGLLGPNGAGKSTLMNLLATIEQADQGHAEIYGYDLSRDGAHHIRSLLGYVPQRVQVPIKLTGWEFMNYAATMKGISDPAARKREVERVLAEVHLTDRAGDRLKSYSGGMRQRIGIAQALLGDPKLFLFDEPTTGLDPSERIAFRNLLRALGQKCTVIISTHIVSDLETTCDEVVVFHKGYMRFQGRLKQLAEQAEGSVWEKTMPVHQAEEWFEKRVVVNSIREADGMRIRFIASPESVSDATAVNPSLEDGYVAVLKELE
ncbi:ABC transporter ATP-binding protein [Paenibacillus sp. DMB20]|uniref:ABC transporter ATP-binding protein n=1 Tax=Paenibacillus sp. DMB20 TaxID=1642570 RepID=UPI000627F1A4|nr:ABC transporter ATP-binding protein [Paenibacillus sp. DMB20]KKO54783.1 hypothetical protein XI25_04680 [Paenibacillus sp. DMB20]